MTSRRKDQIRALLKGIETGDAAAADVVNSETYIQHNPEMTDGLSALRLALEKTADKCNAIEYDRNHRLLAEGSFVLSVSEGSLGGVHSAFYDLFRVAEGRIVEHWDTIEAITMLVVRVAAPMAPARTHWAQRTGRTLHSCQ